MTLEMGNPTTEQVPFNLDSWEPEKVWRAGCRNTRDDAMPYLGVYADEQTAWIVRNWGIQQPGIFAYTDAPWQEPITDALAEARELRIRAVVMLNANLREVYRWTVL